MSRMRFLMAFLAGVACMATPLSAQTPLGSIPKDVMAVLLQTPDVASAGSFDLQIGTAPSAFPRDLLPPATRVQVAAIAAASTTVVGVVTVWTAADLAAFEGALGTAGWIDERSRPAGLAEAARGAMLLCRGGQFATVSLMAREPAGMFVRASVTQDPKRSCAARPTTGSGDLSLPSLRPPSGADASGAGIGGNADAMYTSVRLRTTQALEAVSAHYVAQLTSAGWHVEGQSAGSPQLTATRLGRRSATGEALSAALVVTALGDTGQVDVLLRVVRNVVTRTRGSSSPD